MSLPLAILVSKLKVRCLMAACRTGRWVAIASHRSLQAEARRWRQRYPSAFPEHQP